MGDENKKTELSRKLHNILGTATIAAGGLLCLPNQVSADPRIQHLLDTAKEQSISSSVQKSNVPKPAPLLLTLPDNQDGVILAGHRSHSSHRSHRSHYSGTGGSSTPSHYSSTISSYQDSQEKPAQSRRPYIRKKKAESSSETAPPIAETTITTAPVNEITEVPVTTTKPAQVVSEAEMEATKIRTLEEQNKKLNEDLENVRQELLDQQKQADASMIEENNKQSALLAKIRMLEEQRAQNQQELQDAKQDYQKKLRENSNKGWLLGLMFVLGGAFTEGLRKLRHRYMKDQ